MRGVILGALMLAGLEAVVSTPAAASRTGGLLTAIGGLVDRFLDPTVPAIPDLRAGASDSSSAALGVAPTGDGRAPIVAPPPRHPATAGLWSPTGQRRMP